MGEVETLTKILPGSLVVSSQKLNALQRGKVDLRPDTRRSIDSSNHDNYHQSQTYFLNLQPFLHKAQNVTALIDH
jgi:hypothetical protein